LGNAWKIASCYYLPIFEDCQSLLQPVWHEFYISIDERYIITVSESDPSVPQSTNTHPYYYLKVNSQFSDDLVGLISGTIIYSENFILFRGKV